MTIGEIPPGQSFTVSAMAGAVRYTVIDHVAGLQRDPLAGLTRCSHWNDFQKTGCETTFASHLEAHPAPGTPAGDPPTSPAGET